MRTVSAQEARRHLGQLLDDVRQKSLAIIVARGGKPMAVLCPCSRTASPASPRKGEQLRALKALAGLPGVSPRAADAGAWLNSEREDRIVNR